MTVREELLTHSQLIDLIESATPAMGMSTSIVAIDGCGGAGKSTFAALLSALLGDCPIVHTDDFASSEVPLNWYPRLLEQVFEPLSNDERARFQRYDWETSQLAEWREVPSHRFLIVEGVSAARREFRPFLAFSIFVETDRETRLARGLVRDGKDAEHLWLDWMREEDEYLARDDPIAYADLVVSGNPASAHDSAIELVALV